MNFNELQQEEIVEVTTMQEVSGGLDPDPFGRYLF